MRTKKLRQVLRASFGKAPDPYYHDGDMDYIRAYFDFRREHALDSFLIDDITWNDLDMDRLYRRINPKRCTSGEQYLYYMLRSPAVDSEHYDHRKKLIDYAQADEERRLTVETILARLGSSRRADLCRAFYPSKHGTGMLIFYLACLLLMVASVICTLLHIGFGVRALLASILINCYVHEFGRRRSQRDYDTVNYAMPEIIGEWDAEKNGDIKPEFVGRNSKLKYYWICPVCGYSYLAAPIHRYRGTGCPACAGKVVFPGFNDLKTKHPEVMVEWDYEKNSDIDPSTLFYRSSDIVWWKCKKGHSWKKSIYSRTYNKSGCPYCTGRQVLSGYNDLQTKRPDLAAEWDYSLNATTPDKVHYNNQTIQAHWICKQCGHKWVHTVSKRGRCPECLRRKTQINVYNADDLSLYGVFENARKLCEHFELDYKKKQANISNVCRQKNKLFLGKYILRYPIDDEFAHKNDTP